MTRVNIQRFKSQDEEIRDLTAAKQLYFILCNPGSLFVMP